jgi:hypothetical protein
VSVTGPVGWSTDGEQRTTSAISTTFEAIVLGWEGAAVPDLRADTSGLRGRLEALSAAGVHVLVVSDVAVEQSHSQLQARPRGPGTLYLCGKRGKELVAVTGNGTGPVSGRTADPDEDGALVGWPDRREWPRSPRTLAQVKSMLCGGWPLGSQTGVSPVD